jgi:hypothetical protein
MPCLNDIQIQAVADGEGSAMERAHVATCSSCAARLGRRQQQTSDIEQALNAPIPMPERLARRVEEIFRLKTEAPERRGDTTEQAGATRLRREPHSFGLSGFAQLRRTRHSFSDDGQAEGSRRWIYSGFAIAAATLIGVLFVVPAVRKPDATVSAAEILAKSANQLAATPASGVEFLEYELVLDGVPRDVMPDHANGTYRVKQVIDRSMPGRFRFSSYDSSGVQLSSISQDPAAGRRVMAMRIDDQPYRFEMTLPSTLPLSVPDIEQMHMQASVALMQASGNQLLQIVETPAGRQYRIDVPRVSTATPAAVWDLTEAHLIVDASDFHIVELAVKGAFLKQPYSFSYRLLTHDVEAPSAVPADAFDVPVEPGAITLHGGDGSTVPAADAFVVALRELAKAKQAR